MPVAVVTRSASDEMVIADLAAEGLALETENFWLRELLHVALAKLYESNRQIDAQRRRIVALLEERRLELRATK